MAVGPEHPNLVFILPDRQRRDTLACYGNDWIQVPHLNRLAEESFAFDNCYVTQAVCSPSRASIMSGLYPLDAGMPVNLQILPTRKYAPSLKCSRTPITPATSASGIWATRSSRSTVSTSGLPISTKYRKFKAPFQFILAPRQRP